MTASAVAEVFGVGVRIAEGIGDEHGGLAGELEALAALVTRDEVVQAHHVGCGFTKFPSIFLTGTPRELLFLSANLPAHGEFKFAAAARTHELDLSNFLAFGVKGSLIHGHDAGVCTAVSIVTNSRPRSRQRGSQYSSAARVRVRSAFCWLWLPSWRQSTSPVLAAFLASASARDAI